MGTILASHLDAGSSADNFKAWVTSACASVSPSG